MKFKLSAAALLTLAFNAASAYNVYVDKQGVMRRDDTGAEVAYYGTNYTVPFAHAYRALGQLGVDRKAAIDRDVYHMARLGFDGFRLHLWDVELSDSIGNLLDNDHLDLLDYLISSLKKRNIKIILTAQTNFGNGYPERNTDPYDAFTYDYEKCDVHRNSAAICAQERYVGQLVSHVNKYTGVSYAGDSEIIAMEVNNEPCHSGTRTEVTDYINRMVAAMRDAGWDKPILYNVSHNLDVTQAYYDADIDGTTYQWYPLNLVAGRTRTGNFLPYVDHYAIPFASTVDGFNCQSKIVYEFDPADNLYSYLYPAIARTFRKEGFQWITQFAYDPIDMAWANSEYQTHFLNLAYTPRKALSMMVAAEVTRSVERGTDFGKYPIDTVFGDFMVSARRDLSMVNSAKKYIYTNHTDIAPKSLESLRQVAGWGNSPLVRYQGTGAYFLDRLDDGVWRLEVMPDVILTSDPFAKPSLSKRVGEIVVSSHPMVIKLPGLDDVFAYRRMDSGAIGMAQGGVIGSVEPGVYLIGGVDAVKRHDASETVRNIGLAEFVAPEPKRFNPVVVHTPQYSVESGCDLIVHATVVAPEMPDSVVLYPGSVSFWRERNKLYRMIRIGAYDYEVTIPASALHGNSFSYTITVFGGDGKTVSYPAVAEGTPLDWDYIATEAWSTHIVRPESPILLMDASSGLDGLEISTIPGSWQGVGINFVKKSPLGSDVVNISLGQAPESRRVALFKQVDNRLHCRTIPASPALALYVDNVEVVGALTAEVQVVNGDGFTYAAPITLAEGRIALDLDRFTIAPTLLVPESYPVFMAREFVPDPQTATPLCAADIERVLLVVTQPEGSYVAIALRAITIE